MTVRVFLLDDHELIRIGLRAALETEDDIIVVGEASTADEALARIPVTQPDVALIDLHLEQGLGLDVCRELRDNHPEVRCLVLTAYSDQREVLAALKAGASGYVLKQRTGEDLVTAIRNLAKGGTVLDPAVAECVVNQVRRQPESDPRLRRLSQQERRVLELIAAGATNRQIAATMSLAEKTVRNYVSSLLAKLGMERRSEAAAFAARLAERGDMRWRTD